MLYVRTRTAGSAARPSAARIITARNAIRRMVIVIPRGPDTPSAYSLPHRPVSPPCRCGRVDARPSSPLDTPVPHSPPAEPSMTRLPLALLALSVGTAAVAQEQKTPPKKAAAKAAGVPPTKENVAYGTHPRQVLDLFQAKSDSPTPVVFAIHGGGWVNGDKNT